LVDARRLLPLRFQGSNVSVVDGDVVLVIAATTAALSRRLELGSVADLTHPEPAS
jgi:hypothetical protein